MERSVTQDWPDRNLTEARRIAYRAGWAGAKCLTDTSIEAWPYFWRWIERRYPDADAGLCAAAFHAAWYRREVTQEAAHAR